MSCYSCMEKFCVIITQRSTESYIVHAAQQLLEIELQSHCGETTERLVNVKRLGTHLAPHKGSVLTVMSSQTLTIFSFYYVKTMMPPGVVLKKDEHVVWTPIAARTSSRMSYRDTRTN